MPAVHDKHERLRRALRLERPDRMPCSDWVTAEYRPEVYHLGEDEPLPEPGAIGLTRDGRRKVTRDGGVWAVDARERYRGPEDVLALAPKAFEVEEVGEAMLATMSRLLRERARHGYPVPLHYGTLVTRATIEFGWEPFLMALALEPERLGRILDRFGEASLAILRGWCTLEGVELVFVHDDIAGTRGPLISPVDLRRRVFPWYDRVFRAVHAAGRKVLYMSDGNYLPVLEDLLALGPDGLYVESSSMDPGEVMRRAGRDRLYLVKTSSQIADFGAPEAVRAEVRALADLHSEHPGMMIYRGGGRPSAASARVFEQSYRELLVYDDEGACGEA